MTNPDEPTFIIRKRTLYRLIEVAVSSNLVNISGDDIIDLAVKEIKLVRKNRQQSKAKIS